MNTLHQRLDKLRETIQKTDFLNGEGLANEINIRIFCYDPKQELSVRLWIQDRQKETRLGCNLHIYNLYEIVLTILSESGVLNFCASSEIRTGKQMLQQAITKVATVDTVARRISQTSYSIGSDVILLCGVGEAYPFLRIHTLLEALQPHLPNRLPVLIMYPGKYKNHSLQLYETFTPNGYYRAFNLL